jgi:hypothetical protein
MCPWPPIGHRARKPNIYANEAIDQPQLGAHPLEDTSQQVCTCIGYSLPNKHLAFKVNNIGIIEWTDL